MSTFLAENPVSSPPESKQKRRSERAVNGLLRGIFALVAGGFIVLGANATYLLGVSALEAATGAAQQSYFSLLMLLAHVALGLLLLPLAGFFVAQHARRGWVHRNRQAARVGLAQAAVAAALVLAGFVLLRGQIVGGRTIGLADGPLRDVILWIHRLAGPLLVGLYIAHRQVGRRSRGQTALIWGTTFAALLGVFAFLHMQDPRRWNERFPSRVAAYFNGGADTASGTFIPAAALLAEETCASCHADAHAEWAGSAHRASGFGNARYASAAAEVRVGASNPDDPTAELRGCAACHDPVSLFSGAFEHKRYQDEAFDLASAPTAKAGITCVSCHGVTELGESVGDGRYRVDEPARYPFAYSRVPLLQWLGRQLIVAKPGLHRESMLKPLHQTAEFCGACHKQTIPSGAGAEHLVRAKNHYDSFRDGPWSGRSVGHSDDSRPAVQNCGACHMPGPNGVGVVVADSATGPRPHRSHSFGGRISIGSESASGDATAFENAIALDVFGLRKNADLDADFIGPLGASGASIEPGAGYILEVVLKNVGVGHVFPGRPADERETWLEVTLSAGGRPFARSGAIDESSGEIDPESHFVSAYLVDAAGARVKPGAAHRAIAAFYDNQLPPGEARLVRYRFEAPAGATDGIEISARLLDRRGKGAPRALAETAAKVATGGIASSSPASAIGNSDALARRWNDHGVALLEQAEYRADSKELLRADASFQAAVALRSGEAWMGRARVAAADRFFDDAYKWLREARGHANPPAAWRLDLLLGEIELANAQYDRAIIALTSARDVDTKRTRELGLQPKLDAALLRQLGAARAARAEQIRNESFDQDRLRREAIRAYEESLAIEPAHAGALTALAALYSAAGDGPKAAGCKERAEKLTLEGDVLATALRVARERDSIAAQIAATDRPHIYPLD